MIKLQTCVDLVPGAAKLTFNDGVVALGSCFSDNIGSRLVNYGFDACVNPFGTLYNPVSIANAIARLESGAPFRESDCVEMGANAGLVCSFSHHTSFARPCAEDFLANANESLERASADWHKARVVLITLGTAFYFKHLATGEVVANCLKRPAAEFGRERLTVGVTASILDSIVSKWPEKHFVFTVSPIRHLADGAHGNQLSKSTLLLSIDALKAPNAEYFPAYELMMDELRDYRFYAEDMTHPSAQAVEYIWERFCDFALDPSAMAELQERKKAWRKSQHRPLNNF